MFRARLFGLLFGGGQFGRNGGDGFVAVRDRLQACFVIGLFGEEFAEICGTVFLAERVDGVESVADFLQPFGIGVEPFALCGGRGAEILQALRARSGAVRRLPLRRDSRLRGGGRPFRWP